MQSKNEQSIEQLVELYEEKSKGEIHLFGSFSLYHSLKYSRAIIIKFCLFGMFTLVFLLSFIFTNAPEISEIMRLPLEAYLIYLVASRYQQHRHKHSLSQIICNSSKEQAHHLINMIAHKKHKATILANISLNGIDLSGLVFESIDLRQVRFEAANLENVVFKNSTLRQCNFNKANLQNISIVECDLTFSTFISAQMQKASIVDSKLTSTEIKDAACEHISLITSSMRFANLSNSDFEGADLRASDFRYVRFNTTNLQAIDATGANFSSADFTNVDLSGGNLQYTNLFMTNLKNVKMTEKTILPNEQFWHENADLSEFIEESFKY